MPRQGHKPTAVIASGLTGQRRLNISTALTVVYKTIIKLSQQTPQLHREEAHRVEYLCHAIVSFPWSHEALARTATQGLSFQRLYGKIKAVLQLRIESKIELLWDRAVNALKEKADEIKPINYVGAARDGRVPGRADCSQKKGPLSTTRSFNCHDTGRMARSCPKLLNLPKVVARRLEHQQKKKSAILFITS